MPKNISLEDVEITEQNAMILALESDFEVLAMDENDYQDEIHFTSFDVEPKKEQNNCSYSTAISEGTSVKTEDDDEELFETKDGEKVTPIKVASNKVIKKTVSLSAKETTPKMNDETEDDEDGGGVLTKYDVLCGQSRACANHSGNKRFQNVLDLYAPKYNAVSSKQEKMALTKEIVSCISASGGRFLRYKNGEWQEISDVTARDKVSHALRTKVASWKRQQDQDKSESSTPSPKGKRASHRGRRTASSPRRRRSSSSCTSDIATNSFDSNDTTSNSLIEDLLKTQREIFANLQRDCETSTKEEHPIMRSNSR